MDKEQARRELRAQVDERLLPSGSGPHVEKARQILYHGVDKHINCEGSDSPFTVRVDDHNSIAICRETAPRLVVAELKMFPEFNHRIPLICDMFGKLELQPKPVFIGAALLMPETKFQEVLDLARDPSGGPAAIEALFTDVERFVSHYFAGARADRDQDGDRPDRRYRAEEKECEKRDGYKCVVTDSAHPDAFHIIPWSWNSTEDEIKATQRVLGALSTLFGQEFFEVMQPRLSKPGYTHSSDRAWNMLCINRSLATWVGYGYWGFEPIQIKEDNDHYAIHLAFRWINLKELKFSGNLKDDLQKYSDELAEWESGDQMPVPGKGVGCSHARTCVPIRSGRLIEVKIQDKDDAYKFFAAISIHWTCLQLQSLCGPLGCDEMTKTADSSDETPGWMSLQIQP